MPAAAYALLGVFTAISIASGTLAARLVGPWRWWAPIAPSLAAFVALWLVGHRLNLSAGPAVPLFGFRVSIVLDAIAAVGAAMLGAALQAGAVRLLDSDERRPRRDRLA